MEGQIYPSEFQLNKANTSDNEASCLCWMQIKCIKYCWFVLLVYNDTSSGLLNLQNHSV